MTSLITLQKAQLAQAALETVTFQDRIERQGTLKEWMKLEEAAKKRSREGKWCKDQWLEWLSS